MQNLTLGSLCALMFCTLIGCTQTSVQEIEGEFSVQKASEETLKLELNNQPEVEENEAQLSIYPGGNTSSAPVETHKLQFPKESDIASRKSKESTLKFPPQPYVGCPSERPEVCTRELMPVCATRDNGIRCITAPCPSTDKVNYANACTACADPRVYGYRPGVCGKSENNVKEMMKSDDAR